MRSVDTPVSFCVLTLWMAQGHGTQGLSLPGDYMEMVVATCSDNLVLYRKLASEVPLLVAVRNWRTEGMEKPGVRARVCPLSGPVSPCFAYSLPCMLSHLHNLLLPRRQEFELRDVEQPD